MRKKAFTIMVVASLIFLTGCSRIVGGSLNQRDAYLNKDEIVEIFNDNIELIESIKNGLLESGFFPHDGIVDGRFNSAEHKYVSIRFNHETSQIFNWSSRPNEENFYAVQNIHGYATDFLSQFDESIDATIMFWQARGMGTLIEFDFRIRGSRVFTGITYPIEPFCPYEKASLIHIEDNWYFHWNMVP